MKFLRLDWKDIEVLCYKLSKKIKKENFKPDLLVGLARGGLVPTRILSDILNIKNVAIIRTELYSSIGKRKSRPKILQPIALKIKNKKILLVDDVCDSGTTLSFIFNYLKSKGAAKIKVATLHLKPAAGFAPDFFVAKTSAWIVYPWEKNEIKNQLKVLKK